jgi:two-component system nitrate/nitrite response regulator NarL
MEPTIRIFLFNHHQIFLWGLQHLVDNQKPKMETVGVATSEEEALQKIERISPDVVVLGLDMEEGNSLEIVRTLTAPKYKTRILIVAGGHDQHKLDEAILSGARGIVHKDESPERIVQAIEKMMAGQLWLDRQSTRRLFEVLMERDLRAAQFWKHVDVLTAKEKKVIEAVMMDSTASNKVIAERLFISEHTLRHHFTSIYRKLGVNSRLALYLHILNHGETAFSAQRAEHLGQDPPGKSADRARE